MAEPNFFLNLCESCLAAEGSLFRVQEQFTASVEAAKGNPWEHVVWQTPAFLVAGKRTC